MAQKNLSEAAAEILMHSVKSAGSEAFGAGKKLPATPGQTITDIGTAGHKSTDSNYDATKGVPKSTPPGQTPPVGSEPMKKISGQPQQSQGRSDLAGSPEGGETSEKDKVDRKKGPKAKQTLSANKGAKPVDVPESEEDEDFEPEEDDFEEDELEEATMEEVQADLQKLSDEEFQKKYGASKKEVVAKLKQLQAQQQTQRNEGEEDEDWVPEDEEDEEDEVDESEAPLNKYKQKPIKDQVKDIDHKVKMNKKVVKPDLEKVSCKEDIDAILAGENLSEEFKEKATVIFEAAVNARVESIQEEMEKAYLEEFESAVESIKEDFTEKLDSYLDYVIENWMEENKLAVESGIRTEIAEDFMEALRNVFVEHYIDIPEEKADLVDGLVEKVDSLEESLNSEMSKVIELKKEISEYKKSEIVSSVTEGLTLSQREKIKGLANGVDFISEEDYENKLITIRENYFPSFVKSAPTDSLDDPVELDENVETKAVDPLIDRYAKIITKHTKF